MIVGSRVTSAGVELSDGGDGRGGAASSAAMDDTGSASECEGPALGKYHREGLAAPAWAVTVAVVVTVTVSTPPWYADKGMSAE